MRRQVQEVQVIEMLTRGPRERPVTTSDIAQLSHHVYSQRGVGRACAATVAIAIVLVQNGAEPSSPFRDLSPIQKVSGLQKVLKFGF